jgi:hypothetical protein
MMCGLERDRSPVLAVLSGPVGWWRRVDVENENEVVGAELRRTVLLLRIVLLARATKSQGGRKSEDLRVTSGAQIG